MKKQNSGVVLALLVLVAFANYINRLSLGVLQVPIKRDLGLTDTEIGSLFGLYFSIPYIIMAIPLSRWADRGNRKNLLMMLLIFWSLSTCLIYYTTSFSSLVALRMILAIGEAGCLPICYSLIADYFPPERRGTAIAIFGLAMPGGALLGLSGGGLLENWFGWRGAFLVIGLFGLVIAPVLALALREPPRVRDDGVADTGRATPLLAALAMLWKLKTYRYLTIAAGFQAYTLIAIFSWTTPFYARVNHMPLASAAFAAGVIFGVGGCIGTFLGGLLSDKLSRKDGRWYLWIPALACLLELPFLTAQLALSNIPLSVAFGFVGGMLGYVYIPPSFAVASSLVEPKMRAFASALLVALTSFTGGALAPFITGYVSDLLFRISGQPEAALRYAMLLALLPGLIAAGFYARAAFHIRLDVSTKARSAMTVR